MTTPPRASVVIPVLGDRHGPLQECIRSIERAGARELELVIVGSTPPAQALRLPERSAVIHRATSGIAHTCTAGAAAATAPILVFVDPGCEVHDGWLEPLLEEIEDPTVGAVGACHLDPTGRVLHAGMALVDGGHPVYIHRGAPGGLRAIRQHRDLHMVSSLCMAIRRDRYLEYGGFDPGHVRGFEGADLCLRLVEDGRRIRYRGDSVVTRSDTDRTADERSDDEALAMFADRWGGMRGDRAALLADDGIGDRLDADCIWAGPLFDGSPEARLGRDLVTELSAIGLRPMVVEYRIGDVADGMAQTVTPAVLAAVNRTHMGVTEPVVFHHDVGADLIRADDDWPHVIVRGPGPTGGRAVPPLQGTVGVINYGQATGGLPGLPTYEVPVDVSMLAAAIDVLGLDVIRQPGFLLAGAMRGRSGYARACRGMITAAERVGLPLDLIPLDTDVNVERQDLSSVTLVNPSTMVIHGIPVAPGGTRIWRYLGNLRRISVIGATCFESTGLPQSWVTECNRVPEVWVPTAFNRRTFAAAGVDEDRIHCIPYPVDLDVFRPGPAEDDGVFTFLSVFEWTWRKGWDVLLDAYLNEFDASENVRLRLVTYRGAGALGGGTVHQQALGFLADRGLDPEAIPEIELLVDPVTTPALVGMYRSCGAFVLPTRGEGAGMPVLEAAACGAPVIATAWGGHEEVMDPEAAFPVEVSAFVPAPPEMVRDNPLYDGQFLAQPDVVSLRSAMRSAFEDRADAATRARRGMELVRDRFSLETCGRKLLYRAEARIGRSGWLRSRIAGAA